MVVNLLAWAGAETQLFHLARGLAARGWRPTVVAISGVRVDVAPLLGDDIRVIALHAHGRRARGRALVRLTELARECELVHCTGWDASLWGRLAAILARRPAVFTEHTPGRDRQVSESGRPRARWIAWHNRLLQPFTSRVVACARWQISILTSEGVPQHSIALIPNGVPIAQIAAEARGAPNREELGIPDAALVVIQAARFVEQKNQLYAFEAVARLRGDLGDIRLLLVGDGPERLALEQRARAQGAVWCVFLGERNDVPGLIGLADLAVLPSSAEAMPMSMIEAMAAGVPFVGTDVGDVRAVLEETGAGLWAPVGDLQAFVEACRVLLGDEPVRRRMAKAATIGAGRFDAATMSDAYARLFSEVVAARGTPA